MKTIKEYFTKLGYPRSSITFNKLTYQNNEGNFIAFGHGCGDNNADTVEVGRAIHGKYCEVAEPIDKDQLAAIQLQAKYLLWPGESWKELEDFGFVLYSKDNGKYLYAKKWDEYSENLEFSEGRVLPYYEEEGDDTKYTLALNADMLPAIKERLQNLFNLKVENLES